MNKRQQEIVVCVNKWLEDAGLPPYLPTSPSAQQAEPAAAVIHAQMMEIGKTIGRLRAALWAIANTYDDNELRRKAMEAYDTPIAALAPSASPAALTVPRSVLERAANYIELPPEGHDDGILALDLLKEISTLLAASPADQVEDARAEPTLTIPVEELVEALGHAKSLLEELPAHTVSGTRTAYAYNMVSAAINKVQRAAMSASKEGV